MDKSDHRCSDDCVVCRARERLRLQEVEDSNTRIKTYMELFRKVWEMCKKSDISKKSPQSDLEILETLDGPRRTSQ